MTRANIVAADSIPWVPLRAGMWMRPLCFLDDGYSLQLRVAPGTKTGPHRHTGEVNALMLSGRRRILTTGEVLGPGDFVHEPPGNEDDWACEGDEDCVIMITLTGRVEYLGPDGNVDHFTDTGTAQAAYRDYCTRGRISPLSELFRGSRPFGFQEQIGLPAETQRDCGRPWEDNGSACPSEAHLRAASFPGSSPSR